MRKKKVITAIVALFAAFAMAYLSIVSNISDPYEDPIQSYDREYFHEIDGNGEALLIKEKKYGYNGADVMILNVENRTEQDLNLILIADFNNSEGDAIKAMTKIFRGFPGGYDNYFVFEPGVTFDTMSMRIVTSPYGGTAYVEYLNTGHDVLVEAHPRDVHYFDEPGKIYEGARVELIVKYPFDCTYPDSTLMRYTADFVLFDAYGEIYSIDHAYNKDIANTVLYSDHIERIEILPDDVLWDDYVLPMKLKGDLKCIIALNEARLDE